MAKGDDIQERLINFSFAIIRLCEQIPSSSAGKHISAQLLRSGTSAAFNYGEARGAESKKDFSHKPGIVMKELNATGIALEIVKRSNMLAADLICSTQDECRELSRIIIASIKTVEGRK